MKKLKIFILVVLCFVAVGFLAFELLLGSANEQNQVQNLQQQANSQDWNDPHSDKSGFLVLDLAGDGIEITHIRKGTYYDLDNNGIAELAGWVRPNDAFVVHDMDGDGLTTDATELLGGSAINGFYALKKLDSNGDNIIDASDEAWDKMMIWKDGTGDGYADKYEMQSFKTVGIAKIVLDVMESGKAVNGSVLTHEARFTYTNGMSATIANVALQVNLVNSNYKGKSLLGANDIFMPNLRGAGLIPNLHIVSGKNKEVYSAVKALEAYEMTQWFTNFATVSDVARDSRKSYTDDARRWAFLEAYYAQNLEPRPEDSESYVSRSVVKKEGVFEQIKILAMTYFFFQIGGWDLFNENAEYDTWNDRIFFFGLPKGQPGATLRQEALNTLGRAGAKVVDKRAYWAEIIRFINTARKTVISPAEKDMLNQAMALSAASLDYDTVVDSAGLSDQLTGTELSETLRGTHGDDVIYGLGGTDVIYGDEGNDTIDGGADDDQLEGGDGDDHLIGGDGNDGLDGGNGNDFMEGGEGNDSYVLKRGIDTLSETGNDPHDGIMLDTVYANVTAVKIKRIGFSDLSIAIELVNPKDNTEAKIIDQFASGSLGQIEAMWVGQVKEGRLHGQSFGLTQASSDLDMLYNIYGLDVGETIDGRSYSNVMASDHTIYAGGGDDTIYTTHANDTVYGGAGNDIIYGGRGLNVMHGEGGADVFHITDIDNADLIADFNLAQGDVLNVSRVIDYDKAAGGDINDFLRIATDRVNGGNDIKIRKDGTGSWFTRSWIKVADLMGEDLSDTPLNDLIASGNLVVE